MTDLFILLILIGLGLYGAKEYYQVKYGIVPKTTPESAIIALADLLERSAESGTFAEISSGYGRAVLSLSERLPSWDIVGIEHSLTHWIFSNMRTIGRNTINCRFFWKNLATVDLDDYDVIFVHQESSVLKRWEASLARRLAPGSLLITYQNALPRAKAIDTITVKGHVFHLYRKAAGARHTPEPPPLPIHMTDDQMGYTEEDYDDIHTEEQAASQNPAPAA